jgi:predicted regulator of Ras-like GTPase activity (Roadblock/LC7/MglB family)
LTQLDHVRGGLLVAPDGLVIAATLPPDIPVEPLSALAATLGRELELRGPRLRRGTFLMAHFVAEDGTVFLGGTPVGFIVLLADASVNRDVVRHALREVLGTIRHAWTRSATAITPEDAPDRAGEAPPADPLRNDGVQLHPAPRKQ